MSWWFDESLGTILQGHYPEGLGEHYVGLDGQYLDFTGRCDKNDDGNGMQSSSVQNGDGEQRKGEHDMDSEQICGEQDGNMEQSCNEQNMDGDRAKMS